MTAVTLSWPEIRLAGHIGIDRHVRAMSAGRHPTYGVAVDDWQASVTGALGECALAKVSGRYWVGDLGRPDGGAPDVGPYHVRCTDLPGGCLILRPKDDNLGVFVLVIARLPEFRVVGWCYGVEGKVTAYLRHTNDGRPDAWFVPQTALRPIDELMRDIA